MEKVKYILGILAVGGALAGCAKVSTEEPEAAPVPVSFSTYGQRPLGTKADTSYVAPGADFAEGAVISVFGFYHDDSTWAADSTAGVNIPNFMYDQAVTKQNDGSWSYSPLKYWPNEHGANAVSDAIDRLSFWAYYPKNASGLNLYKSGTTTAYDNESLGLPKATFTQAEDPANQTDLMFAVPQMDLYKNDAGGHGTVVDGEVGLVFKHALALVEFQLTEGTGATLNTLTLTHIKKSGTVENPARIPFVWSNVGTEYTLSQTGIDVDEATILRLLVVPQTINADATFTLNYDITFASSDPTHPDPIVYTGDSFSVKLFKNTGPVAEQYGITAWEAGKHYIYKITAGLDRIEFEEIVESGDDWTVANNNISVPE